MYGVNTGFGSFAEVRIDADALDALQINLLRSHAAGVGPPLPVATVRAMMLLRANVLARGHSGIRAATIDALIALLNAQVHPVVPSRGSVGASGDLAPLAHLRLVLIGEGEATCRARFVSGRSRVAAPGLQPVRLGPKEGLALINGTQASDGRARAGAPSGTASRSRRRRRGRAVNRRPSGVEPAFRGTNSRGRGRIRARRFPPRISPGCWPQAASTRPMPIAAASRTPIRALRRASARRRPRCTRLCPRIVDTEANASTDNPMVFADTGEIVSGGNFHGAPIGIAADLVAIVLAQLATISERRSERLVNPALSGLPPFLTHDGGLESGLMLAQVTAAALASEMKSLAHPASVDTIPTSGNKEDHVSMSMTAALKAERAVVLATRRARDRAAVRGQAIDLLAPLTTSAALARVHRAVRTRFRRTMAIAAVARHRGDCTNHFRGRTRSRQRPRRQLINFCLHD